MTTPEPSPLPRFGIRHLLGLTAALAVAFTFWRESILNTIGSHSAGLAGVNESARTLLHYAGSGFVITSITCWGIDLFLVGCLILWSWKFDGWKAQPGHFVAWATIAERLHSLLPMRFDTATSQSYMLAAYALFVTSTLVSCMICIWGSRRSETTIWRVVLLLAFLITSIQLLRLAAGRLAPLDYNTLVLVLHFLMYAINALIFSMSCALAVGLFMDYRSTNQQHWSHWWATSTAFAYYLTSSIYLAFRLTLL